MLRREHTLAIGLCAGLSPLAAAQGPGFTTPGMPGGGDYGQSDRFSNEFNPAISVAMDMLADWVEVEDDKDASGANAELRRLDLLLASWIDSRAWAYAVIAYEGGEFELDEAAIQYVGLPGRHTLKAGRFFVDFGKQMQAHIEELDTIERPLVLREYLGEELAGDGLQWDYWFPAGERTVLRTSIGAFASLLAHEHGEEHDEDDHLEPVTPERVDFDQINYTARLTGFTELGALATLQAGVSLRAIPSYGYETDDLEIKDLSNRVYGVDLTYGRADATHTRYFAVGAEWLFNDGDLAARSAPDSESGYQLVNDRANGYYAWVTWRWNQFNQVLLQFSRAEVVSEAEDMALEQVGELDINYTRHLSEFLRLRAGFTLVDATPSANRFAIQLTALIGPHGHGLNW